MQELPFWEKVTVQCVPQKGIRILRLRHLIYQKDREPASDTQVVFRDSAFANDIAKTNMTAILEQNGIKHVRSL